MESKNSKEGTMKNTSKKATKEGIKKSKVKITKFDDLEGKFLHVRVGSHSSPADDIQIKDIQDKIVSLFEKNNVNCLAFVTHHAVAMSLIEKDSKD